MIINREVILVKEEVTYNLDPVPVEGDDAILVENLAWANEGLRMNERPAVRASIGQLQQVYGGMLRTVTFDVEMKGSGVAGTPPEMADLLEACGMLETVVAVTSVTYTPASTGHKSATVYYYQDGTLMKLTGCRGSVSFNMEVGAIPKASFTMTGHVSAVTDIALASPTYDSIVPAPFINAAFDMGGYSAIIGAWTFDIGNEVSMPPDPAGTDGFGEVRIIKRDVNGSVDPEHQLVATKPFDSDFKAGVVMTLASGAIGGTAGNILNITHPAIYYKDVAPGDREGIRTLEIPYGATESTTDDEVAIAFT